jgi:hypothetical protein
VDDGGGLPLGFGEDDVDHIGRGRDSLDCFEVVAHCVVED